MNGYRDKERAIQTQRDSIVVSQHRETNATEAINSALIETETTENGFTSSNTNGSSNLTTGGIGEEARSLMPIGTDGLYGESIRASARERLRHVTSVSV